MTARRVLVTGSRDWADLPLLRDKLSEAVRELDQERVVIVHGKCDPRHPQTRRVVPWAAAEDLPFDDQMRLLGADWLADRIAGNCGTWTEHHPADWDRFGKSAGPRRNAEMVNAGADICLAFIRDQSRGASHCAGLARAAGIPLHLFTA